MLIWQQEQPRGIAPHFPPQYYIMCLSRNQQSDGTWSFTDEVVGALRLSWS